MAPWKEVAHVVVSSGCNRYKLKELCKPTLSRFLFICFCYIFAFRIGVCVHLCFFHCTLGLQVSNAHSCCYLALLGRSLRARVTDRLSSLVPFILSLGVLFFWRCATCQRLCDACTCTCVMISVGASLGRFMMVGV
ncbi:hypothetical protein F5141DRAFT_1171727 [Pisolithus sp. B1]|nr:hypothetical protein F5141DRAFT_1171727 [Pisolithus sp. B1]